MQYLQRTMYRQSIYVPVWQTPVHHTRTCLANPCSSYVPVWKTPAHHTTYLSGKPLPTICVPVWQTPAHHMRTCLANPCPPYAYLSGKPLSVFVAAGLGCDRVHDILFVLVSDESLASASLLVKLSKTNDLVWNTKRNKHSVDRLQEYRPKFFEEIPQNSRKPLPTRELW